MYDKDKGHPSDMDAVLAYRNYLAAEDHLDELIVRATTSQERIALEAMLDLTIELRDEIMPAEADPTKHCLVKHYAAGYEAVRERWKALRTEELYWAKKHAYDLLIDALEMLWDRTIITCERCNYDKRNSSSDGGDTGAGDEPRQSRDAVQSTSSSREPGILSVQTTNTGRTYVSGSGSDTSESESGDTSFLDWNGY